jgi:hypothetical protein
MLEPSRPTGSLSAISATSAELASSPPANLSTNAIRARHENHEPVVQQHGREREQGNRHGHSKSHACGHQQAGGNDALRCLYQSSQ